MATHGRSGVGRWMMGSIADKVLHGTSSPMLITHSKEGGSSANASLKSMIIPLDGSSLTEQILPHATQVAKAFGLNVILVRSNPSADEYYRFMDHSMAVSVSAEGYEDYAREAEAQASDYLAKIQAQLVSDGVTSVETKLLRGSAAGAILDMAEGVPDCLIALTTHGRSGVGRWVLGGVADRLVRHSGTPVLVVRANG